MEQVKRDEIEHVEKPDSREGYPDFLFNPLFNTYDDSDPYWSLRDESNPRVTMIRNTLKTKYNRYEDYIKAVQLYYEYMEELAEDYGGMQILLNTIKEGNVTEYVPPEPRIKASKKTKKEIKRLYKYSQSNGFDYDALDDVLGDIIKAGETDSQSDRLSQEDLNPHVIKNAKGKEKQELQKWIREMEAKDRIGSIYSRRKNNSDFDMIAEYYRQLYESGGYTRKGKEEPATFKEYLKRREAEEIERLAFPDGRVDNEVRAFINGNLVPPGRGETIEFLKELYTNGYNVVSAFSKGMKKQEVRMLKRNVGIVDKDTMSKKMKKKLKRQKKIGKHVKEQSGVLLSRILNANGMNISDIDMDDEDDALGMTYEKIMKGRYK